MPEKLKFPIFDEPYGRFLSACGFVEAKDRHTLALIAAAHRRFAVAIAGKGRTAEYVGVRGNEPGASKRHLHLDVGVPSYFKPVSPKPVSVDRITALVAPLYGKRVRVNVEAVFEVPWSELSPTGIVRTTLVSVETAKTSVRQTGATIAFGRDPDEVKISFNRRQENVRVYVESGADTTIGPSYLNHLHSIAFDAFCGLILERVPDEVRRGHARQQLRVRKRARRPVGR